MSAETILIQLLASHVGRAPGPMRPAKTVIEAIVPLKPRNARHGCQRIARQFKLAFGLELDKEIVRRVLANHYGPDPRYPSERS